MSRICYFCLDEAVPITYFEGTHQEDKWPKTVITGNDIERVICNYCWSFYTHRKTHLRVTKNRKYPFEAFLAEILGDKRLRKKFKVEV